MSTPTWVRERRAERRLMAEITAENNHSEVCSHLLYVMTETQYQFDRTERNINDLRALILALTVEPKKSKWRN